jgi:MFS family permease
VIIASLVIFGIFVYFERHISNPRYDLRIFRNLKYLIGNYSAFVMYAMAFIASYILNFYLQYVLGYDSRWTGLFLLSTPVAVVFVSSFAGKLADRVDERIISSIALVFILIDVLLLFFMDVVPLYMLLVACILQGIGHGLFSSPNNRFVLTQVSEKDLSNASAVLSTSKDVGKSISLAMFTVISGFFMGSANTYDGNVSAFLLPSKITLAISLLLGISALILLILNRLKD